MARGFGAVFLLPSVEVNCTGVCNHTCEWVLAERGHRVLLTRSGNFKMTLWEQGYYKLKKLRMQGKKNYV